VPLPDHVAQFGIDQVRGLQGREPRVNLIPDCSGWP
jgi:hypothetical protein